MVEKVGLSDNTNQCEQNWRNTFQKTLMCLKTQHAGRSVITISSYETYFGNLSFTAQEAKCCPYAMDESTSWKLSKSWQSHMQTTQDTPALSLNLRLSTKKRHVPTAILSLKPSHQISNAKEVHKDAISYTLTLHPTCFTKRCSSAVSAFFQHPTASVLHTKEHHQENPSIAVSLRILR